ncbi:ScbR family autoregulator-binding transcription factor [Amycolatopsis rhabdoformis]|uniref:ScbR family autoregulator-binding transcription factor n=1 Tax=Amycolatopsis rhabdoformis TaxID=1448059 RepID=A0ABZ1HYE4_9PSEU|nr:ScbR family autoregulator-binding transcription factor [Amycolatopsis rhabdoformis]WSE26404.1 ScbR family autoregulator-binding transcription factor [Amycolatopsis rhabdoformis]
MTKQARAEQTRILVLAAAAELLHRDGYAATSMVDIARQAGITKGGLYFHFSSKDEICDEVQDAAVAVLREHVSRIDRRITAPPPALRRLADLSRALMHWLGTDPRIGASFRLTREMGAKDARYVTFTRAWLAQVRSYISEAHDAGELSAEVLPDMATLLVVVTCVGLESVVASGTIAPDTDLTRTLSELWRVIELAEAVPSVGVRRS